MADYNPVMFTLARESRGKTQQALAEEVGLAQGTLSKIEAGLTTPNDTAVHLIAEALDYPDTLFKQNLTYRNLPVTFYRKQKTLPATAAKRIQATINIRQLQLRRLLASVDLPSTNVPVVDLEAYEGGVERLAREVRIRWHVPPGPIGNVTRLFEENGVLIVPFEFGSRKIDGVSIHESATGLPPVIFVSQTIPGDRLRWTLVHELAHIILHHHLPLPPEDSELEADHFASEFLLPRSEIRGQLGRLSLQNLANLKLHWKVSMQALIMRAFALGAITEGARKNLFAMFGRYGYRRNEPVTIEREEPVLVEQTIQTYLTDLGYSAPQLREVLLTKNSEFLGKAATTGRGLRIVR